MRKFPKASLPIFKRLALEPYMVTADDLISSTRQFAFDDIWLFHGVAMEWEGKAMVLSGPLGIGKSTLLRKVVRHNLAKPLDDGHILVGGAKGDYYVLESGLYPVLRTISVASKMLRILSRYRSPYLRVDLIRNLPIAKKRGNLLHDFAVLIGSIAAKSGSAERVISRPVRLGKLLLVTHQSDCHPPRRVSRETIEDLQAVEAEKFFNNHVSCEVISSYEDRLGGILDNRITTTLRG